MSLRTVPKFDLAKYPALKPGVNFFKIAGQDCSDIYIGFSNRGIEVNFEIAFELLRLFDGSRSLEKITSIIKTEQDPATKSSQDCENQIPQILQLLSDARLIEFRTSPLPGKLPNKDLLPVNLVNSLKRMRAEANLYSWHPQIENGISAETLISKRRYFSIMIYGRNRLALSLFTVLQASGFSLIKLTDRAYSASANSMAQIEPDEVCGLAIRGSDVGLRKALVLADLARNSQLFPLESLVFPDLPDLIISTESIPQETMQSWMSENIVHLPISNLIEEKIQNEYVENESVDSDDEANFHDTIEDPEVLMEINASDNDSNRNSPEIISLKKQILNISSKKSSLRLNLVNFDFLLISSSFLFIFIIIDFK
jgi:hypothetical protein